MNFCPRPASLPSSNWYSSPSRRVTKGGSCSAELVSACFDALDAHEVSGSESIATSDSKDIALHSVDFSRDLNIRTNSVLFAVFGDSVSDCRDGFN